MSTVHEHAQHLASQHPENFPVASVLLPAKQRRALALIYTFARRADDFADEGTLSPEARLQALDHYASALQRCQTGQPNLAEDAPFFDALSEVVQEEQLSFQPFFDLLKAFRQDVLVSSYASWASVLDYCRYSANPVGALVLQLAKADTPRNRAYSDAICTVLQLLNFFQDVFDDQVKRSRCYLPIDRLEAHGLYPLPSINELNAVQREAYTTLLFELLDKTEAILQTGYPLVGILSGRLGFQVRVAIYCAVRLLKRLRQAGGLFRADRLNKRDFLISGLQALFYPFFPLR